MAAGRARLRPRAANYEAQITSAGRLPARPRRRWRPRAPPSKSAQNRVDQIARRRSTPPATRSRRPPSRAHRRRRHGPARSKAGEVTVIGTMNNPGTQLMTDLRHVERPGRADGRRDRHAESQVGQKALLTHRRLPRADVRRAWSPRSGTRPSRGRPGPPGADHHLRRHQLQGEGEVAGPAARASGPASPSPPTSSPATSRRRAAVPLAAVIVRDSPKGEKNEAGKLKTEEGVYALRDGKAVFATIKTGITGRADGRGGVRARRRARRSSPDPSRPCARSRTAIA